MVLFKHSTFFLFRCLPSTFKIEWLVKDLLQLKPTLNDAKVYSPNAFNLSNKLGAEESSAKV